MGTCTIKAYVKNKNGDVVESKLFEDLKKYAPTREEAKDYYKVGTNKEFLERVKDIAEFDENGEITFQSLKEQAGIDWTGDKVLKALNKEIGEGTYSYNEAINKLQTFNREHSMNDKYMATIKESNNNKYYLSVVDKNATNIAELTETIKNRSIIDRVKYYLNKVGVGVEYLDHPELFDGKYSTKNAKQAADGLYYLVSVVEGKNMDDALLEEAGHTAIGTLGRSPLVQRLLNILTPEVVESILAKEGNDKLTGSSPTREVAGHLVGKAFGKNPDKQTIWGKLASKIANLARKVFATLRGDDIMRATIEAEQIARDIAEGFLSPEFNGTIDDAIQIAPQGETFFSTSKVSTNVKVYREAIDNLAIGVEELRAVLDDKFYEKFKAALDNAETGRINEINAASSLSDYIALEGIVDALTTLLDLYTPGGEIDSIKNSINFTDLEKFYKNMSTNSKKIRQLRTFLKNSVILEGIISHAAESKVSGYRLIGVESPITILNNGTTTSYNLLECVKNLRTCNTALENDLTNIEHAYFLKFCEDTYGSTYVHLAAQKLFKGRNIFKLQDQDAESTSIAERLEHLEDDTDFMHRWIGAASNSGDLIGEICDKVAKIAHTEADNITRQMVDNVRLLYKRWKKLGLGNTRMLYEVSRNTGKMTGNLISNYYVGDWEDAFHALQEEARKKLKEQYPDIESRSNLEQGLLYQRIIKPMFEKFNEENSIYDPITKRWKPNEKYANTEFRELYKNNKEFASWYEDYMELKRNIDALYPEGSTHEVRAPQFRARAIMRIKNRLPHENFFAALGHALGRKIMDEIVVHEEDDDFGSMLNINNHRNVFKKDKEFEADRINRIPILGINKMRNIDDLSIDLFYTTLCHATCASRYHCMNTIVDSLEIGKEVLLNRTVGKTGSIRGIRREKDLTKPSRAYSRYLTFLEMQVYNIMMQRLPYKVMFTNKLVRHLNQLAGFRFLGGNVFGGLTNTGTGAIEVFKEAVAGDYFTVKDWKKANEIYFNGLFGNYLQAGRRFKDDSLSLFIRHFNAVGRNEEKTRDFKTSRTWGENLLRGVVHFPYSSGDHYMQSMAYLMSAINTKVYDRDGNEIPLYKAYGKIKNDDAKSGVSAGWTYGLKGTYFKRKNASKTYDIINSILGKLENAARSSSSILANAINLTTEEEEFLNSKGLRVADISNTRKILKDEMKKLLWLDYDDGDLGIEDRINFENKAREINDRLHGIYNSYDKTAFHQKWYGYMFLGMKGWALGQLERRFGSNHYNVMLGRQTEGNLNTTLKAIISLASENSKYAKIRGESNSRMFWKFLGSMMLPFGKRSARAFIQRGFSAEQFRNMRRTFIDLVFMGLLLTLRGIAAPSKHDDEDDAWGLLYYFSNRLFREQSALYPHGWHREKQGLIDPRPGGISALLDYLKLGYEFFGSLFADKSNSTFFYKRNKRNKYRMGDPKYKGHFIAGFPYWKDVYKFQEPYDATAGFEWGQTKGN